MPDLSHFHDPAIETADRETLDQRHDAVLAEMLPELFNNNPFYRRKWGSQGWDSAPAAADFSVLPFTTKQELVADAAQAPPYGTNLTYPLEHYVRLHQTSGTSGHPLVVLDTADSWESWKQGWASILKAAGVRPGDCVFVAFSFGPFVGFWSGFEAAQMIGCRVLTGGGQSSSQRLDAIYRHQARVLLSTPSYALYLAEAARQEGRDLAVGPVEISIHAGEPGASIPATRARIEAAWGARCFDHVGASEVGPYGFDCHARSGGVHVNEWEYICEVIDSTTQQPVPAGVQGELVMTNLNRWGFPVVRYRTGDLVRFGADQRCDCGRWYRVLEGGVLGRSDDMMTIRGINIFPSSIEAVVREVDEVVEFQGTVSSRHGLDQLTLNVELTPDCQSRAAQVGDSLARTLRRRLGLRIDVAVAEPGSLPRFELKARRFKRE